MSNPFCDQLNNVISFFHDKFMSCCAPEQGLVYYYQYNNKKEFDFSSLNKNKQLYFEELINNKNLPCHRCFYLREKKDTDLILDKYKEINISHWTNCNCNCVYCSRNQNNNFKSYKFFKRKNQYYNLLPIIKGLYEHNLLDKENLIVRFQGGDIGVLKEFETLVREFDRNGINMFHFLSNNIIYQPIIAEMFNKKKALLVTSLDCGSRETYKRIKRVDKFYKMINNLIRYKSECGDNANIHIKYIITKDYNDNLQEAENFLSVIKDIKVPQINYDIDYRDIMMKDNFEFFIPNIYYKIHELFEEYCKENNCIFDVNPYTKNILEQGYFSSIHK